MPGLSHSSRPSSARRPSRLSEVPTATSPDFASPALLALGQLLREHDYVFTVVTPATHAIVLRRDARLASSLRDVFGWNLPFEPMQFRVAADLLAAAGALLPLSNGLVRSAVRYASVGARLFVHSGFPTLGEASVFFGPDTLRFARAIGELASRGPLGRVVDIGAGSGAGGIFALPHSTSVVLSDINAAALNAARTNLVLNDARATTCYSDILSGVEGPIDTVLANPPFMADSLGRAYRDGGGLLGTGLAVRIAEQALARLAPGGRLLLYSGAPIVGGRDVLAEALGTLRSSAASEWRYEEIDPDIFGDELSEPGYRAVERIAAVQLTVTMAQSAK